jgi:hypothetical protein
MMRRASLLLLALALVAAPAEARIKRSHAAAAQFQREHPCPSTGEHRGHCPGYVIDHVDPLACGGADPAREHGVADRRRCEGEGQVGAKAVRKLKRPAGMPALNKTTGGE